ncbi:hypothetical protein [Streptomyces mirabilis]|uniref:hypothetical protein n=1 Tax=Streptomyces mirabilis TaxID=68239 RepID=UPI00369D2A59
MFRKQCDKVTRAHPVISMELAQDRNRLFDRALTTQPACQPIRRLCGVGKVVGIQ